MARIRFTNMFAERIGGIGSVDVRAATVESALRALTDRHPQLTPLVWAADGTINPVMAVFLNDRQLGVHEFASALKPEDQIDIVPAVEGG